MGIGYNFDPPQRRRALPRDTGLHQALVAADDSAKLLPLETTGHKAPNAWRFGRLCFCDSIDISAADQETLFVEHAMTQVEHVEEEQDNLPKATATIEDAGAARKRIKLDIPEERIKGKLNDAFGELQRDAVLPGFRRGRAPKRLIEKRFGGDMRNTVKQQLVAEAYEK